jgi:hypothetical protein
MMYAIALLLAFQQQQEQPSRQLQEQGFEIVEMQRQQPNAAQRQQSRQVSHYNGKARELKPAKMKHQGVPKFKKPKALRGKRGG